MSILYRQIRRTLSLSLLAVAALSPALWAQSLGNSPYSAYGIGELYSQGNATNLGMGGVGISNASPFYLNLQNPALLARRTRFTVFEVGLIGQSKTISQNVTNVQQNQQNVAGNLAYLALAFPANSRWTMGISLRPYSYVDYATRQYTAIAGTPYTAQYDYTGKGGLNKASFTHGVRVSKNIFVGVEGSFLFGNITTSSASRVLIADATTGVQNSQINRINRVNYSDLVYKLGASWRPKLSEKYTLNLGATYDPQIRVNARQTDIFQQTTLAGANISTADTLGLNSTGLTTLPQQAHFGISLEQGTTFLVGVDVGFQKWSQYRAVGTPAGSLTDGMTVAAGVEFTPKSTSTRYRDLITYRAGFQYNKLPYSIADKQINDISVSGGVSLPLGAFLVNHVTLSVIGGQRGVLTNSQVREQYVRFALGFSLNDWWFRKQVVD